jgi:glycosyltransferase involved in cell wall biosynthesis
MLKTKINSKISLAHIVPSLWHGGTEQLLYDILRRINKEKFDCTIVCTGDKEELLWHDKFQSIGVNSVVLSCDKKGWRHMMPIYKHFLENSYDVVHIHNYSNEVFYARRAAILARVPVIMTYDHNNTSDSLRNKLEWGALNQFTHSNVCVSNQSTFNRKKCCGWRPKKVVTIRNGVDLIEKSFFTIEVKNKAKISHGYHIEHCLVGAVGRLIFGKRFDLFIQSIPYVKNQKTFFILRGDGHLKEQFKKMTNEMGISPRLSILPWVEDVNECFRVLDILVATSDTEEGFGLVVAEAMASGIPVIATDIPAYREVLGDAGLIVDADPKEIAKAIDVVLKDPTMYHRLSEKGRKRVEKYFDINHTVQKLENLYFKAATEKGLI